MAAIKQEDVIKLQCFHDQHFPNQGVPNIQPTSGPVNETQRQKSADEDLGFYEDGVRRTLTDEQIAMFRHSEIQRLLADRRRQKDLEEQRQEKAENMKSRSRQQIQSNQHAAGFDTDEQTHSKPEIPELSYDDNEAAQQDVRKPTTFQWPKLGP